MIIWISRLLLGLTLIPIVTVFLVGCLIVDRIGERSKERE